MRRAWTNILRGCAASITDGTAETEHSRPRRGFSLVELLIVIAVIAVIAAIAIPNIARIRDSADNARHPRNAQSLALTASAAVAAGADPGVWEGKLDVVNALTSEDGITGRPGTPLKDAVFRVSGLAPEDVAAAMEYLDFDAKVGLIYKPES